MQCWPTTARSVANGSRLRPRPARKGRQTPVACRRLPVGAEPAGRSVARKGCRLPLVRATSPVRKGAAPVGAKRAAGVVTPWQGDCRRARQPSLAQG
ncbi:hypothetical protein GW17_00036687 [Ensete ventricosum]|nr:hypothetical protein GW17_00036687 [Ensete ventricosum]